LHCRCGDLAARGAVERLGLVPQALLDDEEPELGENAGRGQPSCDLEAPDEDGASAKDEQQRNELARELGGGGSGEGARDDRGEQRCLREDEEGGGCAERDIDDEQPPHRPRSLEEAWIERAHPAEYHRLDRRRHHPDRAIPDGNPAAPPNFIPIGR
jgi:hypothetical protein